MDRGGYIQALVRLAETLGPADSADYADRSTYLTRLVAFAAKLKVSEQQAADAGLEAFRRVLKANARDILWRVAGATLERRRLLPVASQDALRTLGLAPDLLGPLGFARTELAHSSALAFFLDPTRSGSLGTECLSAFVELVVDSGDDQAEQEPPDLTAVRVTSERSLGRWGRVDISIDGPRVLILVEVKVDAKEGPQQIPRYTNAINELAGDRQALLVFLTHDREQTGVGDAHRHITFADVLRVWLPIATTQRSPEATYLAMYMKTIAQHLQGLAGEGGFDRWDLHTQRAALAFIERELET
jgi:hypothetical protein